jgi:hypothetical protein
MKSVSIFFLAVHCIAAGDLAGLVPKWTDTLPPRAREALSGSQFAKYVSQMDPRRREQAILHEIVEGDIPDFLRKLVPVEMSYAPPGAKPVHAIIFVSPDYLAIGSSKDFLRIPMNFETATAIADRFGFVLPTKKMVDAIYNQSAFHFVPEPLPAGPQMRSTAYYQTHNNLIETQARSRGFRPGMLAAGDKKDVVVTNLLARKPGRIAIYGWQRASGTPIQPLSTVHGVCYADYSHGIRLVAGTAIVNGQARPISQVLEDPALAGVLSDEGPLRNVPDYGPRTADQLECGRQYESAQGRPEPMHISGFESPSAP